MKKIWLWMMLVLMVIGFPSVSYSKKCDTKYPIVLSHGMNARAKMLGIINYWSGAPDLLRKNGAEVYITDVNSMDTSRNKGLQWKKQVNEILAISGAKKVNVIGHSHGCVYTRYAITNLGMSKKVVSHTSLAGPHRGSVVADLILQVIPNSLEPYVGKALNIVYTFLMKDENPNSVENGYELVRSNMENVFNPNTPNIPTIYYQSYAYKITNVLGGGVMYPTWRIMLPYEGDNDGLVSVDSAKWGEFKGVITGWPMFGGVNHIDSVHVILPRPGYDPPTLIKNIAMDLKKRGY